MPAIVKNDRGGSTQRAAPAGYVRQGLFGRPYDLLTSNPAYAQVQNEHVWQTAWSEINSGQGDAAGRVRESFKRVEEIFAKYRSRNLNRVRPPAR